MDVTNALELPDLAPVILPRKAATRRPTARGLCRGLRSPDLPVVISPPSSTTLRLSPYSAMAAPRNRRPTARGLCRPRPSGPAPVEPHPIPAPVHPVPCPAPLESPIPVLPPPSPDAGMTTDVDDCVITGVTLPPPVPLEPPTPAVALPPPSPDEEEDCVVTAATCGDVLAIPRREIRALLTGQYKDQLLAIVRGEVYSERHQLYVRGGRARRELDYGSNLSSFASGTEDAIMDVLLAEFCPLLKLEDLMDLDYILRVLLPEALLMLHLHPTMN